MHPRSEHRTRTLALIAVLHALAQAQAHATEAATPSAAVAAQPDGDPAADEAALDTAIDYQAMGRPWLAEATLQRLADSGHVVAMERLALLHWYGHVLYPGEPWSRAHAADWFGRAAAQGSELGRHMTREAQRLALREQAP